MSKSLQIRFRKERQGPEAELVNNFLSYYSNLFKKENLEYSVLTEVYAEIGIPDIVIVAWDKSLRDKWSPERNKLEKKDIKILHHISTYGKRGVVVSSISEKLGFSKREIENTIGRLNVANLISVEENRLKIRDFNDVFFVKKIISIEAKIKNWKGAFAQAKINENFSSHSYVLLPDQTVNESVISNLEGNIGLLVDQGEGAKFKRKAKKAKLPGSYFSWVLNEYVGRQFAIG